jgi:hypothetical protein
MRSKTLVVVIAFAVMGVSSTAIAKGGGGGGGAGGKGGSAVGHFGHGHFFGHHFRRNQAFLGGWGWGWGPYGEGGYTDTTVVVSPRFPAADVTGSVAATPCHWNSETFTVPSSSGGNRPVEVVSCR